MVGPVNVKKIYAKCENKSLQVVLAYIQVGFAYIRVRIAAAPVGLVHLILTNMKTRKRTIQTYIIAMEDFNAKVGGHTHTSNCRPT